MRHSSVLVAAFALLPTIWFCSVHTVLIRSDYGLKSNELEQYHRYRNLTGHFKENFFASISCEQTDHGDMRECLNVAMKTAKDVNLFPPLWKNRIAISGASRRDLLVDCSYSTSIEDFMTTEKHGALYASFKILQSNCSSKTDVIGGASFHAVANSGNFMVSCGVVDLFSNNYTVQCRIPTDHSPTNHILNSTHRNNTAVIHDKRISCMNISITLIHEHFDAFGREGGMSEIPHSLNHEVFKNKVCHRGKGPSPSRHLLKVVSKEYSREHQRDQSQRVLDDISTRSGRSASISEILLSPLSPSDSHEYVMGIWIRDRSGTSEHPFEEHIYNYKWSSGSRSTSNLSESLLTDHYRTQHDEQLPLMTLSKENYALCQKRQTNVLLGESHQRFTWSYLAYHYHDGQALYLNTLTEKHGDVSFFRFNLTLKYFIKNIVRHLDDFNCSVYSDTASGLGRNISIAMQMGSWDLSALPLRTVMDSPAYGTPALLEAIRRMQLRGCSDTVKIVLVQTMPYPMCNRDDFLCMSSQHWHNNYATSALSAHMLEKLSSPPYRYDNLEVIDAVGIMSADLGKYECVNHFLCRHGEKQRYRVASTPSGEALSCEIINALCE